MHRTTIVAIGLALAVLLATPVAGLAGAAVAQNDTDSEETDEQTDVAPGERLSGVLGAQQAELDGEVEERTFGVRMAAAQSNDEAADVVDGQADALEQRLTELEERKADLDEQRAAGEITEGQYAAQVTRLSAEQSTVERVANHTSAAADELPNDTLAAHGIDVEAIHTLRTQASELSGPEVAAIAQSIAGPNVGQSVAEQRGEHAPGEIPGVGSVDDPEEAGPPGDRGVDAGNETDADDGDAPADGETTEDGAESGDDEEADDADDSESPSGSDGSAAGAP